MKESVQMEIEGPRLRLREFRPEDVVEMAAYEADPAFLRFYPPDPRERRLAAELIPIFIGWSEERPRQNHQLAIEERAEAKLVGTCGVRSAGAGHGEGTFGIAVSPACWGRGVASEAARLMLRFAFDELKLTALLAESVTENARIATLLSRLGFRAHGRLPGEPWMERLGWTYTEWRLRRSEWAALPPGG